jgi:hypothetical protein
MMTTTIPIPTDPNPNLRTYSIIFSTTVLPPSSSPMPLDIPACVTRAPSCPHRLPPDAAPSHLTSSFARVSILFFFFFLLLSFVSFMGVYSPIFHSISSCPSRLRLLWGCVGLTVPALPSSSGLPFPTPHIYIVSRILVVYDSLYSIFHLPCPVSVPLSTLTMMVLGTKRKGIRRQDEGRVLRQSQGLICLVN